MIAPAIDITDLSKFYGKARGIEQIDLEIGEGEIFTNKYAIALNLICDDYKLIIFAEIL
jgi:hypothetical protein